MAAKRITMIFISDGAKKVRQIRISKLLLILIPILFFSATALLVSGTWDYQAVKAQIPELARLEKENKQLRVQLVALAQKGDQISKKMIELKKFDHKLKVMVNLETGEYNAQFLGIGGSDPALLNPNYTVEKAHRKLVRLMHQSLDNLSAEASIQINEKAEFCKFLEKQKSILACTPSIWPVRGWVTSGFGYRISPFTNEKEFHRGIDISARVKKPIVAPAHGIISSIGFNYGYGKILTINHANGITTRYAHLSKVLVKKGQHIDRGQKIALVGKTGRTTGPHLHYEVHLNGVPMNPRRYILN